MVQRCPLAHRGPSHHPACRTPAAQLEPRSGVDRQPENQTARDARVPSGDSRTLTIFGSDCACADGRGGGVSQAGNPGASRLAGKCVARETLTLLRNVLSPDAFRKVTWDNAHRIYSLARV